MPKTFAGFSPKALTFLRQLAKNNSRDWFQPRKQEFVSLLQEPMLELLSLIVGELRAFAVDHVVEPKKAMLRIYRDVRFSKDKSPYKTNIAAMFPRRGLGKTTGAGYYLGISPEGVEIAGGIYMPGPPELLALRNAIAEDPDTFRKLLTNKPLVKLLGSCQGETATRVPKGFAADHPAADLLRKKQFFYFVVLKPSSATATGLDKTVVKCFRQVAPVIDHLNGILLKSSRELDGAEPLPKRPKPMF
jgi:uncharacterized protein (TIGR02453 family)